jgi:hypothetical protein
MVSFGSRQSCKIRMNSPVTWPKCGNEDNTKGTITDVTGGYSHSPAPSDLDNIAGFVIRTISCSILSVVLISSVHVGQ